MQNQQRILNKSSRVGCENENDFVSNHETPDGSFTFLHDMEDLHKIDENNTDTSQSLPARPFREQTFTENPKHLELKESQDVALQLESELSPQILTRYNKFGKWKAYENISSESACFSFLPDILFKWRNIVSRPFTLYPFVCLQLCWGELILLILMTVGTLGLGGFLFIMDSMYYDEDLGLFSSVLLALSFATAGKNTIFHLFLGMPFEREIIFHKFLAFLEIGVSTAHGLVKGMDKEVSLSGLILCILCGSMILSSFFYIRRYCYRLFYLLHILMVPAIITYAVIHKAAGVIIGVGFWGLDVVIRIFLIIRFKYLTEQTQLFLMPGGFIRVEITPKSNKRFRFKAGQYVFINIPGCTWWEWHPFSICNTSYDGKIVLHFKAGGRWTRKIKKYLEKRGQDCMIENTHPSNQTMRDIQHNKLLLTGVRAKRLTALVMVNGPYGCPRVDIDSPKYQNVLLVTGGIGVSPMHSIFNELIIQYIRGRPFVKIKLVWVLREKDLVHVVAGGQNSFLAKHPAKNAVMIDQISFPNIVTSKLTDVVETEIYLTQLTDANIKDTLEMKYKTKVFLRRPDIPAIFETMGQSAADAGRDRVGVLSCCPSRLTNITFRQSQLHSKIYVVQGSGCQEVQKKKVNFHFHSEVFEF